MDITSGKTLIFRDNKWPFIILAPLGYLLYFYRIQPNFTWKQFGPSNFFWLFVVTSIGALLVGWGGRLSTVEISESYIAGNNGTFGRSQINFSDIESLKRVGGRYVSGLYVYSSNGNRIIVRDTLSGFDEIGEIIMSKRPDLCINMQ